jgi:hypothetical protein
MKGNSDFKRHLFTVSKVLETVLHYEQQPGNLHNLLTEKIKLDQAQKLWSN